MNVGSWFGEHMSTTTFAHDPLTVLKYQNEEELATGNTHNRDNESGIRIGGRYSYLDGLPLLYHILLL